MLLIVDRLNAADMQNTSKKFVRLGNPVGFAILSRDWSELADLFDFRKTLDRPRRHRTTNIGTNYFLLRSASLSIHTHSVLL